MSSNNPNLAITNLNTLADSDAADKLANEVAKRLSGKWYATDSSERPIIEGTDRDRDPVEYRHDLTDNPARKNFDQKVYMFPDSYNALRVELSTYWPELWRLVQWRMAYRAEEFIEYMNAALDVHVVFDTEKVDFTCKTFLNLLREKRGISRLSFN